MELTRMDRATSTAAPILPARLHHAAYVSANQERTRAFYEDVLGIPLTGFWIEREVLGGVVHEFSLALYGLQDGSSLSFFNFANPELQQRYTAKKQELFVHLALDIRPEQQDALLLRLEEAGIQAMAFHHGYARSLYVEDPDGQRIEFCAEAEETEIATIHQRGIAHDALRRWQAGDRTINNTLSRNG